ncbi:hypothetical protein CCACVL1_07763 [Corchorus capsularis]|uniref:Uncharacterized protein n=1 Tax=Corchorus capsularis TaxID=210143 RepID=A0A1R3J426_COCAP|nr:hypothetical protein CCACVL1_07763 [Corchorus capsularis]
MIGLWRSLSKRFSFLSPSRLLSLLQQAWKIAKARAIINSHGSLTPTLKQSSSVPPPASMEESESTSDNQQPWQSYHTVYTNAKAEEEEMGSCLDGNHDSLVMNQHFEKRKKYLEMDTEKR